MSTTNENIEAVKQMILDNRRITIIAAFGSCQAIFTNVLGMKRAAAEIVPKLLNIEQKWTLLRRCLRSSTAVKICSKSS